MKDLIKITWKNFMAERSSAILHLAILAIAVVICIYVGLWIHEQVQHADVVLR